MLDSKLADVPTSQDEVVPAVRKKRVKRTSEAAKAAKNPMAVAVGRRLRTAREEAGYTVPEVAHLMKWKEQTIHTWENGWALAPVDKLAECSRLYKQNLQWLVLGEAPENYHELMAALPSNLRAALLAMERLPQIEAAVDALRQLEEPALELMAEIVVFLSRASEMDLEMVRGLAARLGGTPELNRLS